MSPDPADHGAEAREAVRAVIREALDREADWSALAEAGLLSLAVPEAHGGEGLGLGEIAVLLRETGARASHLPVWETLCCGALTLAAAGSDEQQARLLPGIATGDVVRHPGGARGRSRDPGSARRRPSTDGRVTGRKVGVTHADGAAALLVPAMAGDDVVVALVDPAADGVSLHASPSSSGRTEHTVVLDGAPAELLPGDGAARLLRELAVAGLCVTASGVVAGARDLTAAYIKGRTQFGRKLAEFQAVAQQIADVYVASRLITLAADNAVWRVSEGLDATDDLAVAAYFLCDEGLAALHTCQHLHGGMGVDETYPLHHYFSWVTDITHALGGPRLTAGRGPGRGPGGQEPRAHRGAAQRSRPSCATTSPAWPTTTSTAT